MGTLAEWNTDVPHTTKQQAITSKTGASIGAFTTQRHAYMHGLIIGKSFALSGKSQINRGNGVSSPRMAYTLIRYVPAHHEIIKEDLPDSTFYCASLFMAGSFGT